MRRALATFALLAACGGPAPLLAEDRAAAQQIWKERCSNCHGTYGLGDGPGAKLLPKPPRDFSDRAWQEQARDDRIALAIVEGGAAVGLDHNMAANPDLRKRPEVVRALVEIVRGW